MSPTPSPRRSLARRTFLAGAAAGTVTILNPGLVRGSAANETVRLGLVGCGGRGNWLGNLFNRHGKYRWTALADFFPDRLDAVGDRLEVPADRRFPGLDGYRRLLEAEVDAVVIQTPPYFHPEQAEDSVAAGKHVFLSKPVAVDVPGCKSIAASGAKAGEEGLVYLVDFQTRACPLYREALARVHRGEIGRLILGESHYPWAGGGRGAPPADTADRLRHWYFVKELSGDFVVEQAIHVLDVATWIADADPIQAVGTGGRLVRHPESIWDHFAALIDFPEDFRLTFAAIQSIPGVKDEIRCRVFGADGVMDTDYFGDVWIRGERPFEGGHTGNLYTTGAETNIAEFHQAILDGDASNPTVAPSVRSNLTAILAREAGYARGTITWEALLADTTVLEPDLRGVE